MDAPIFVSRRATAFLVQYRGGPTRGEPRNVAVALVAHDGGYAAVKHLPPSQLGERIRERGIVDGALVALARAMVCSADAINRIESLRAIHGSSLLIGDPMPTDLGAEPDLVLASVFKALVARPVARRAGRTKGEILDRTVATFRRAGAPIRVGQYVGDFLLDAIVEPTGEPAVAIHAQSFEGARREWSRIEHETGHFLYAVEHLRRDAICVIQPPAQTADDAAAASYSRVGRWLTDAGVTVATPAALATLSARFGSDEQLPLIMAS